MGEQLEMHTSLAFYQGYRPVCVWIPRAVPSCGEATPGAPETASSIISVKKEDLFSIALHRQLMPPTAEATLDAEIQHESYAQQIAGEDGMELLRLNWKLLLAVLFPSLARGQTVGGLQEACRHAPRSVIEAAVEEAVVPGHGAPLTVDMVHTYVTQQVTPSDFRQLRDPGMLDRVHYSYVVLLRFFGWRIHDEQRGVLDRHRHWESRYAVLASSFSSSDALPTPRRSTDDDDDNQRGEAGAVPESVYAAIALLEVPDSAPVYGAFNFYDAALLRALQCLLQFGFITYAVRLVEFVMDEIVSERLPFLLEWVGGRAVPLVAASDADESHKKRLQKKWYKLTHSDSD